VASLQRIPAASDVPAIAETLPGFEVTSWEGILAPAGTPAAVVSKLAAEAAKAMRRPDTVERLTALGLEPVGGTPEAFTALVRSNLERYAKAVKISGARVN
jgi:tripartite-type tricarboxylate transporter receptor subunit TctC